MSFLNKFFREQKEKKLEKQAKKQKSTAEDLKLDNSSNKGAKGKVILKRKETKKGTKKEIKKDSVKLGTKGTKPKFKIDVNSVLIKPLITEKISDMAVSGKYGFKVSLDSNKIMVKKAVSTLYGVKVIDVKIINVNGKKVRYGRQWGKRQDWKKAIVSLAPGERIEVYEGV